MNSVSDGPYTAVSPAVHFFPFADGGVLFRKGSRQLLVLNATSALIWCLFAELGNEREVASAVSERYSVGKASALRDVEAALNRFREAHMLRGPAANMNEFAEDGFWPPESGAQSQSLNLRHSMAPSQVMVDTSWAVRQRFDLQGYIIEFRASDPEAGRQFLEFMAPFISKSESELGLSLTLRANNEKDGTYDILLNSAIYAVGKPWHEALPLLFTLVFIHTCTALSEHLLFHAAAIVQNGRAVVFPAETGSGKTTLAGALAASGLEFFSDEITALDTGTLRIRPLPLPMSVKPGSVEVLEPFYPGLGAECVYLRADGKRVRYVSPPASSQPKKGESALVEGVVFPRYQPGGKTEMRPLGKTDALRRLATSGSSGRELRDEDIQAMIDLVERSECYELVFSDLQRSLEMLGEHFWKSQGIGVPRQSQA